MLIFIPDGKCKIDHLDAVKRAKHALPILKKAKINSHCVKIPVPIP